jgi:hypothetical protein
MPKTVVFVGPSLPSAVPRAAMSESVRPPAQQGDVWKCVREGAERILLLDGYFEAVPAVLHRELLFALDRGVEVHGAASLGAIRAAELHRYGMIGHGIIFERYLTGELQSDDEVALAHGPPALGYPPLSAPLVNIRETIGMAVKAGKITQADADLLISIARQTSFRDRSMQRMVATAHEYGFNLPPDILEWFRLHWSDLKKLDAENAMERFCSSHTESVFRPPPFIKTQQWHSAVEDWSIFLDNYSSERKAPNEL